jgi:ABC-type branched-subunit amino acid transport system substrate-binding protein
MAIKVKLIILLVLAIVLVGMILVPDPDGSTLAGSGFGASGSSSAADAQTPGAAADAPPVAASEWYFVLLTDVTGANAEAGVAAAWGLDYGVKAVNEAGGARGVDIRSAVRDTASDAGKAVSELTVVAENTDKDTAALLIFGPVLSDEYAAAAPSFAEARLPAIGSASGPETLQSFAPYAVSGETVPGEAAGRAVSAWLTQNTDFQKIALIYDSSVDSLRANIEQAKSAVTTAGRAVTVMVETSGGTFDAAGVANAAFGTGADAYYIDLPGDGNKRIAEQLIHLNKDVAPGLLLGSYHADLTQMSEVEALSAAKVYIWSEFDPTADAERRQLFDQAFDKAIGNSRYYDLAVDYCQAARFAAQGIEALGLTGDPERLSEERDQLAAYLRDCGSVSTPLGNYSMSGGRKVTQPDIYQLKDGKFVKVT